MKILLNILLIMSFTTGLLFAGPDPDSMLKLLSNSSGVVKADLLLDLAKHYKNTDSKLFLEYANKSLEYSRSINYRKGVAESYRYLGLAQFNVGNYQAAIDTLNTALVEFREIRYNRGIGNTLKQIGDCRLRLGRFDNALENYLQALKYFESIEDLKHDNAALNNLSGLYISLGFLYRQINKSDDALTYLLKAIDIDERINNMDGLIASNINIGLIYYDEKDYITSLEYQTNAYKIAKSSNNLRLLSTIANNIGQIYINLHNYKQAINYLIEAHSIYKSFADKNSIFRTLMLIGEIYYNTGNYEGALKNYQDALEIAKEINARKELLTIYSTISKIYEQTNNYNLSLYYHKLYTDVKDTIYNSETSTKLARLQVEFDTRSKEKQIRIQKLQLDNQKYIIYGALAGLVLMSFLAMLIYSRYRIRKKANNIIAEKNRNIEISKEILEQQNNMINTQNQRLRELNATKDKFFSIIAHDLRSPLGLFISISDFLSANFDKIPEDEAKKMIHNIHSSALGILSLLENLLEWARSQTGGIEYNPSVLNLHTLSFENIYIHKNSAEKKKISLINEIDENVYVHADENMLNTVFRNLLSNAIKFTHENGEVRISAIPNHDYVQVSIIDNGVGITDELAQKLFKIEETRSTPGTHHEKGSGLGLIICKEFIEMNGGRIWLDTIPGKGTCFNFTLRKSRQLS